MYLLKQFLFLIYSFVNINIMDSGLYVLHGMMELRKFGLFAYTIIKNGRNWPKYVPRNMVNDHMVAKEVVSIDTLYKYMDNIAYESFCLKELDCIMKIMYTYVVLLVPPIQKE